MALKALAAAALASVLAGCAFTGLRGEPKGLAVHRYNAAGVPGVLRGMSAAIDVADCVEMAMVSDCGVFGGNSFAGTIPLKKIVQREFEQLVTDVFRAPVEGEREQMMVKVTSQCVILNQYWSETECEMSFDVRLLDPVQEGTRPYYRGVFTKKCRCENGEDDQVPQAVYEAIRGIVEEFLQTVMHDRNSLRRLSELVRPDSRTEPPQLVNISFGEKSGGRLTGECEVACNGWEGFDADRWARQKIRVQCQLKLGIEEERVRVVFRKDEFSAKTKTWKYSFVAFPRAPLVMDYDRVTRSGVCVGDLGLLRLQASEAAVEMKKFILQELRSRSGAQNSEHGSLDTLVRFDDFSLDAENNQMTMKFRLVY